MNKERIVNKITAISDVVIRNVCLVVVIIDVLLLAILSRINNSGVILFLQALLVIILIVSALVGVISVYHLHNEPEEDKTIDYEKAIDVESDVTDKDYSYDSIPDYLNPDYSELADGLLDDSSKDDKNIDVSGENDNKESESLINPGETVEKEDHKQVSTIESIPRIDEGRIVDTTPKQPVFRNYRPVPLNCLAKESIKDTEVSTLKNNAESLQKTFESFGIEGARVSYITNSPYLVRYEMTIPSGVHVSKIKSLENDIAFSMAAPKVEIMAPIPGKRLIGIDVYKADKSIVYIGNALDNKDYKRSSIMTVVVGVNELGKPIFVDLDKAPHLLIAGSSGTQKNNVIDAIILSLLCKESPRNVRMMLVDTNKVALSGYNSIPHLVMPRICDMDGFINGMAWLETVMDRRLTLFAQKSVREIEGYNKCLEDDEEQLPYIIVVITDLAELMKDRPSETEKYIRILADKGRATGIHMIIDTSVFSYKVLTGPIRGVLPSKIVFKVPAGSDSRILLGSDDAALLTDADIMLIKLMTNVKIIKGHAVTIKDSDVSSAVDYLYNRYGAMCDRSAMAALGLADSNCAVDADNTNDLLDAAVEAVLQAKEARVSIIQRRLGIGYPMAARLIDTMEQLGYIGPFEGSKPRRVLISESDWLEIKAGGRNNGYK